MAFDYKKEYKEFYLPQGKPSIIKIPKMNFIAVRGKGDPNEENGEYQRAMSLLYTIAFTIKMSYKGSHKIEGYFEYVVPPLEGLWWQDGIKGVDYQNKNTFNWISLLRLPEFVTEKEFNWAINEATTKKKVDFSDVEYLSYEEGLCVQCMHFGPYDDEPRTIIAMDNFARENDYEIDINESRHHHEIYLGDPRRCSPSNLKTVIRHPLRKK